MSGRYKAYGEYKESGVEWLGEIPEHWRLKKAKYLFQKAQRNINSLDGIITAFRDGQVTLRSNRRTDGFTNALKEIGYQGVKKGDLLIHAMDGFAGAIGVSDSDGKCSPVCSVCVPFNNKYVYVKFYGYLIRQLAVTDYISSLAKGIRERSTEFRFVEFSALHMPIPTFNEQVQIFDFLDHETAKIDTLIEKQNQLIELLKEKRQAVISHAVTKGLDPDEPMKDSGVEWLGEVPIDWDIMRLKFVVSLYSEKMFVSNSVYVGLENISSGSGKYSFKEDAVPDGMSLPFRKGDVLFGKLRPYLAKSWLATFSGVCSSEFLILRTDKLHSKFLNYFSLAKEFIEQVNSATYGSKMPRANWKFIGLLPVPKCSYELSESIAAFLDHETSKIDTLIELQQQQIELLKERRTALISAAVTGKIDVRDWQVPATQTESDEVMA